MSKVGAGIKGVGHEIRRNWVLFLMILPAVICFIIFAYLPMPGAYIAFVDYKLNDGIFGSQFIGLKNFEFLAANGTLWMLTKNTILYNLVFIVLGNIIQVVFAIMLSEVNNKIFKKLTQSVILLPYFISMVIVGVFAYNFFNYNNGFVNSILVNLGFEKHDFYSDQGIWKYIITFFKIWSGTGYGMIVYLATITGISQDIYEAAYIDGADNWKRIIYITVPMLKPTVILLVLFGLGGIMKGSFDLFYNLIGSNSILYPQTDIIDTYVFRALMGTSGSNFPISAAVGFYQSIFGLILVLVVNTIVRKVEPDSALF